MDGLGAQATGSASSRFSGSTPNTTVYSRVEALTDPRGMVGFSLPGHQGCRFYGHMPRATCLLLTYEAWLASIGVHAAVYQFIGEPVRT